MRFRPLRHFVLAALFFFGGSMHVRAADPAPKPDARELAKAVKTTAAKIKQQMASWTTVVEVGANAEVWVEADRAPNAERYKFYVTVNHEKNQVFDLIIRDKTWYVWDPKNAGKYRPFEAPAALPTVYIFLRYAELELADPAVIGREATVESVDHGVATFRTPLNDAVKRQLETLKRQMDYSLGQLAKGNSPAASNEQVRESRQLIGDLLAHGLATKVDLATGLITESGIPGKRRRVRDFRWHDRVDETIFDVDGHEWIDHTAPVKSADPKDLVMIKHSGVWRPGQPAGDNEAELLNIKTGEFRRVPYAGCECMPISFSADRKRVYVGGLILGSMSMPVFEIDLETLHQRRLGGQLLDRGMVMFGATSPDGKTLAVAHGLTQDNLLQQQIVLIDIASGDAHNLGKPLDCAQVSWLPKGDGLILVSRVGKDPNKPPEGTVCRMDLSGEVIPLVGGDEPFALSPRPLIFYSTQGEPSAWMTCDVDGKSSQQVFDGLPKFGFPAPSPDGNQVLMMKFGGPDGPRPHIVDLLTGKISPITVTDGLWGMPIWR